MIADKKAYITYMANDVQPDENPRWPFIYNALSIVDIETGTIRKILPFASSEKVYDNEKLPVGSCFVARILQKDKNTLRIFFSSENPGVRQSQTWFINFDIETESFDSNIYKAKIKTKDGVFDMQPRYFFQDALAYGFVGEEPDYGLYPFDIKRVDQELYTSLSIYPFGPVGFGKPNKEIYTFKVIGNYFQPLEFWLNESALERLPDGSWMAITRQELGTRNYVFSTSKNGKDWTPHEYLDFVPNGTNAKPVFECFDGIYYQRLFSAIDVGDASQLMLQTIYTRFYETLAPENDCRTRRAQLLRDRAVELIFVSKQANPRTQDDILRCRWRPYPCHQLIFLLVTHRQTLG